MRIAHVTISHGPDDVRIFHKECRSLAKAGHEVHLLVPGPVPEPVDGVRFHALPSVGGSSAYFWRVWRRSPAIFRTARAVDADVYHLPDPALIPVALLLARKGARIVYDAHEDRPRQARTKYGAAGRPVVGHVSSLLWRVLEGIGRRRFDRFIAVTPDIARTYPAERTTVVANFPRLEEFAPAAARPYAGRRNVVVYSGALHRHRCIREAVEGIGLLPPDLDARLVLLGDLTRAHPGFLEELQRLPGWSRVEHTGPLPRAGVVERLGEARIGLSLLSGRAEHVTAMGNKTFEYMAAGLPVVGTDFPVWHDIVRGHDAGLLVDSEDPRAVAAAIEALLRDPERAEAMGRRGAEAVASRYSWDAEARKLIDVYVSLNGRDRLRDGWDHLGRSRAR